MDRVPGAWLVLAFLLPSGTALFNGLAGGEHGQVRACQVADPAADI